jgi:hypothetical protein
VVEIASEAGGVRVRTQGDEAELLRRLLAELQSLLEAEIPRTDPVVARILPDAYEEEEDARSYREMVDDDLRKHKLEALRVVRDTLGGALLGGEQVEAWLTTLTDARLAIGTRLEVDEDRMAAELDPDDPDTPALAVLHWLGFLQEKLVQAASDEEG